ncbi:MAG: tetratricopeptide repeat protein, partial [Aliifodinibius sp.]|nr:tetratricopeptide repeat protein [Fodinibius sp.]NIV12084.1 tetratricopeptide repeat protein [Fodinibius sp.]NIY25713.1 tetratricopeptide repeat protein [Fodinibius sp.]
GDSEQIFFESGDQVRYAMAIGNRAAVYEGLGQLEEAIQLYSKSADILREAGEETAYTQIMQSLSAIQLRTGKSLEALASMQIAMNHVEKPGIKQRFLKRLLKFPNQFLGK